MAQILILKIRQVFLRLKFVPCLTLAKNPGFCSATKLMKTIGNFFFGKKRTFKLDINVKQ